MELSKDSLKNIDAIHYSVRDNGVIRKLAAYVILGINLDGQKEVLTIQVGDNESSKYWLSVPRSYSTKTQNYLLHGRNLNNPHQKSVSSLLLHQSYGQ